MSVSAGAGPKHLGIITGYRGEARCLDPGLSVRCSGADAGRARTVARQLHAEGVAGLVSFGLAGGLVADLAPGDLLLPQAVVTPEGSEIPTDPVWRAELTTIFEQGGLPVRSDPIAGSEQIVATDAAKRDLAARSGAAAVDMESLGVAQIATEAGLPFLVLRAVADRYDQLVPRVAHQTIDAQGEIRYVAVLAGLIRRPWEVVPLIGLGKSSARGLATLRRAAALAGLGFA